MLARFALLTLLAGPAAPPDTLRYVVLNHGRDAGFMEVVRTATTAEVRFQYQDRQRGPRYLTRYRFARDGSLRELESGGLSSGVTGRASAAERVEVFGDSLRWRTSVDSGAVPLARGAVYVPRNQTPYDDLLLVRRLLAAPDRALPIAHGGTVRLTIDAEERVRLGDRETRVRLVRLHGLGLGPSALWVDEAGELVATDAAWFITVRRDAVPLLPALRAIELATYARQGAVLAAALAPAPASALVIRHADLFDSERAMVERGMSIVVEGDRITAVGPDADVATPAGARELDATGRTVLPGLWDMHTHAGLGDELAEGPMHLAAGVTTARDLAADTDIAVSLRDRADRGEIVAPRRLLAGFIEGPGAWAGPSDALARTEAEARALVARYAALGYRQIKLYNLLHPDLVPTIAEEAHRRGLRLSGHLPRGLSMTGAVRLGYDEIQHAAFLFSDFFPDSLYLPRMRAYSGVAAVVAPTFDVDGRGMTALLAELRARGTVFDPTVNIWQDRTVPLPGGLDPVFGPTLAWMPPLVRRGLTPAPAGSADEAASAAAASRNYRRLVKRLFDAGIPIVPGTDNVAGVSFHGELEIYERAGLPAPAVLQLATLGAARIMGEDGAYGSVRVGKVADLAIVAGRPAEGIGELRKMEYVVRAGRLYRCADLLRAAGLTPPAP